MDTYRDLVVWQKSMSLVSSIYLLTKRFPNDELYGLSSQIRRSAISIPSNIAEGYGRRSNPEFSRFLQISMGSLYELQTQLEIAFNVKYLSDCDFRTLSGATNELERMMSSFISKIPKTAVRKR